jgi:uroporphyrinogen decarboxylase
MRQAGRCTSEYRELRRRFSLMDICRQPEFAVAVTMQPRTRSRWTRRSFLRLLVPFTPMGLAFDFVKGEGPKIDSPIRSERDVQRLRRFEPRQALAHVLETIRILRRELEGRVPLIGFGGAPFTLAAYVIEGGPSTSYAHTKTFMYSQPAAWHRSRYFATVMTDYLKAQVEAGAQALQIFDSWAGALSRQDYREFVLPHSRQLLSSLAGTGVPIVHFGVGTAAILREITEAGGDVIGVDWRQPLDEAWLVIGPDRAVQGNLDPTLLLGPPDRLLMAADDVLLARRDGWAHLQPGHGVLLTTPLQQFRAQRMYASTRLS